MEFPTMDEFAKNVAKKALDEYEYNGKTLRQWIEIIYNAELGTNLASLGTDVPDINVGDMISRQAAIDIAKELTITIEGYEMHNQAVMNYCAEIIQLPPIQPKRGRWIGKYPVTSVCSECGFLIHDSKVKAFAYCPNCGADMRGEQNE